MRYTKHAAIIAGIASLAFCASLLAQSGFPPPPPKVSVAAGSIDIHVHSDPDGMEMMINGMKREGISQADIDLMVKRNPARWLGLES